LGNNQNDQLGLGRDNPEIASPTLLPLSRQEEIISVHAAARYSILRTAQDRLLVFGEMRKYVSSLEFPSPIQSISCGWSHVIVITIDGSVYGFGNNANDELALPDTFYATPTLLPIRDITAAACGTNFSLFLTQASLLSCGGNSFGSLGLQNTRSLKEPSTVDLECSVVGVATGGYHAFALMEDGGVLGWGWNCFQQVGPDPAINVINHLRVFGEDMKVDGEQGREDKKIVGIGCSWRPLG
jgi:alpha-tubulin suppressor-like RCC1 family protein